MLEMRGNEWGDKVRIIGLSVDDTPEEARNHVEEQKWTSVEHYHVKTEGCTACADYGARAFPHVVLIDMSGKIVFAGDPDERELEKDIDILL